MEREVEILELSATGHTCSPEIRKRAWRLPFRYRDSLLPVNLVISGFVGLSAVRSFGARDDVVA